MTLPGKCECESPAARSHCRRCAGRARYVAHARAAAAALKKTDAAKAAVLAQWHKDKHSSRFQKAKKRNAFLPRRRVKAVVYVDERGIATGAKNGGL